MIASKWSILPDMSSRFVLSDSAWRFGAVGATTPVQFEIPYRTGNVIQISGRSANVHDQEASMDLCPITRWALGQTPSDVGVPPAPEFLLAAPGAGQLVLSNIGFEDLTNVSSISNGTLQFHYWKELNALNPALTLMLANPLDALSTRVYIAQSLPQWRGNLIQIGTELMVVLAWNTSDNSLVVARGAFEEKTRNGI